MILIKNGKILTMAEKSYERGSVLINNGKIIEVGEDIDIRGDVNVIDAKGRWVLPGFIESHCHIGIYEQDMDLRN
jgi:imidazolonepropionase-like amidohydrolase